MLVGFGGRRVIVVGGVVFDDGGDGFRIDEAGDVVDVAVGVVAGDAVVEPEDFFDAEEVAEPLFDLLAGEVRVSVRVEETGFGGEEGGHQPICHPAHRG